MLVAYFPPFIVFFTYKGTYLFKSQNFSSVYLTFNKNEFPKLHFFPTLVYELWKLYIGVTGVSFKVYKKTVGTLPI